MPNVSERVLRVDVNWLLIVVGQVPIPCSMVRCSYDYFCS